MEEHDRKQDEERYGYAGLAELIRLEDERDRAGQDALARPDDRAAALRVEVADKKLGLFFAERDNAGAFKFKKFGRAVQELFVPGPDGKPVIEAGEDGLLKVAESQAERRFLLVNMGELDRFNKEGGGHDAGDAALGATAAAVEAAVAEALGVEKGGAPNYRMYRYDGNTFMVDLPSMPLKEFGALVEKVSRAEPRVAGVTDPAPLTVRGLDLAHVVGMVNHVQAELPPESKFEPGEDAAREVVEMLRRSADWDMEVNKLFSRAERMRAKVQAGAADAEAFFDNYIKKSFQDTAFATFEGFRAAVLDGSYLGQAEAIAVAAAEKRFADGRRVDDQIAEMVQARVRSRNAAEAPVPEGAPFSPGAAATRGEQVMIAKRALVETSRAVAVAEAPGREADVAALQAESALLDLRIEETRRDKGTGLLDRGVHYEELERRLEEGRDVATVFVDMAFLKYFDQMGGSDVGDAALRSAAAMMEEALARSGAKGEVFRYGGDEFTIQVEGGAVAADAVIAQLRSLRAASEPIPVGKRSRDEYAPTRLVFNYGMADRAMLDELYALAVKEGKYTPEDLADPARVRNAKAELMTKAADVGIEYNKAFTRFLQLIGELRSPEYAESPARRKQVDALVSFSGKALFAELGGVDRLRTLAADRSIEGEALAERVMDYVIAKAEESRMKEGGRRDMVDLLLAAQVKASFLSERLKDMEALAGAQQHQIDGLRTSLQRAEEEKRQIIDLQSGLDRAS